MHREPSRRLHLERYAWPIVVTGIAALDVYLIRSEARSLSRQFSDACQHPMWRWALIAGWGVLSLHLVEALPESVDPFGKLADLLARREVASG